MVLFCHITTKVKGDKHQKLHSEKGGRGWPYIAILDAEGNFVAKHEGDRTIAGFTETVGKAKRCLELKARVEKGDASARFDYLVAQIDLGQVKTAEARKRFEEIQDATAEQKKIWAVLLVDLEVRDISASVGRDAKSKVEAGKKFLEMKEAGRIPKGEKEFRSFQIHLMDYAELEKDARLFEEALKALKERFKSGLNERWLKGLEERLKKLKEGAR